MQDIIGTAFAATCIVVLFVSTTVFEEAASVKICGLQNDCPFAATCIYNNYSMSPSWI